MMIRKLALLVIAMAVLMVAVSCGTSNEIEITGIGEETITVSTEGLSAEQIDGLQSVADGESDMRQMMQNGLFSQEEIAELGLMPNAGAPGASKGGKELENLTMDELNLDGLDDAQITAIQEVLDGERTLESLVEDGILSMEELKQVGLMGDMPSRKDEGAPKDPTSPKQNDATQEIKPT